MKKKILINCHSELVSESQKQEMLKQVQHDKKPKGFTLAEVLITLTIIGVIAAITIPNLMQSWRKHKVEAGVKEAYAILSNAIKMSEAENGRAEEWNWQLNMDDISTQYLLPYIKVSKDCGNKGGDGSCWQGINKKITYPAPGLNPNNQKADYIWFQGDKRYFVLSNGMSLIVKHDLTWGPMYGIYFYIDIDGPKGKSIIGNDIHLFTLNGHPLSDRDFYNNIASTLPTNNFTPGGFAEINRGPNKTSDKTVARLFLYSYSTLLGNCQNGSNYFDCTAVIAKNGWKIPDDYPVKKF